MVRRLGKPFRPARLVPGPRDVHIFRQRRRLGVARVEKRPGSQFDAERCTGHKGAQLSLTKAVVVCTYLHHEWVMADG